MNNSYGLLADENPPMIHDLNDLEERLSQPTEAAIDVLSRLEGDLLLLGAGGKMGPSLARMALRASRSAGVDRRLIAVSRFSDPATAESLSGAGVEVIRGDLFEPDFVASLPNLPLVVYMLGMKFGTSTNPSLTWATNVVVPQLVCRHFQSSRIVAFSSGNVYGPVAVEPGTGSVEMDVPHPVGEYSMSALGRERMFEYFSQAHGTQVTLLRLNYATEMRYGVLVDMAMQIHRGRPIDLTTGFVNTIWQGDANAYAICALEQTTSPATVLNMTGPGRIGCRAVCERLAARMNRSVEFVGEEGPTALLNDSSKIHELYGQPRVSLDQLIEWTADWVQRDGPTLEKPTHFEVTDGKF